MLAAVHTAITGWDFVLALLVVLVAAVLDRLTPIFASWFAVLVLFLAALLTFALLVTF